MARLNFDSKKELKKLRAIVNILPEDKRKMTEGLVVDAAFQAEQLEVLRTKILEKGWSEEYQNGANQFGRKQTVEADVYLKLQKTYAAIIKQLTDLLPVANEGVAGTEILNFISSND